MDNDFTKFNFMCYDFSNFKKKFAGFISIAEKLNFEVKNNIQPENSENSLSNIFMEMNLKSDRDFENYIVEVIKFSKVEDNVFESEPGIFKNRYLLTENNRLILDFDFIPLEKNYDFINTSNMKSIFKTSLDRLQTLIIPPLSYIIVHKKTIRLHEEEFNDLIRAYKHLFVDKNKQYKNIFHSNNKINLKIDVSKLISEFCDYDNNFFELIYWRIILHNNLIDKELMKYETLDEEFFEVKDSSYSDHIFNKIFDEIFSIMKLITHLNKLTLFKVYWDIFKAPMMGNFKYIFDGINEEFYSRLFSENLIEYITRYALNLRTPIEFLLVNFDSEITKTEDKHYDSSNDYRFQT